MQVGVLLVGTDQKLQSLLGDEDQINLPFERAQELVGDKLVEYPGYVLADPVQHPRATIFTDVSGVLLPDTDMQGESLWDEEVSYICTQLSTSDSLQETEAAF